MELERDFLRERWKKQLARTHAWMLAMVFILIGFLLGMVSVEIAHFGLMLLGPALALEFVAYFTRKNPEWSAKVFAYARALATFGLGSALGLVAGIVVEAM